MTRTTRKEKIATVHEVAVSGRKREQAAPNSLKFLVEIEGVTEYDGRVRGANGMRWKVA